MSQSHAPIYAEHAPHPELARYVACYWTVACRLPSESPQSNRVLPDGCMDILFSFGDASNDPGGFTARVVGSMTRPLDVEYAGRVELMGVRFRPGGATPYLELPASDLTDQVASLDELWGHEATRLHGRLGELDPGARISLLDEVLIARLRGADRLVDERVLRVSEAVATHRGAVPVDRLADQSGLGRRQLERRFLACVGVSPKVASRIARFQAVISRMHAEPTMDLSRLALEAGYADQPHLNREFRTLADMTPGTYLAEIRARDAFVQDDSAADS